MKILCLGTSYTGRYIAVNFRDSCQLYFLSRSPGCYPALNYFSTHPNVKIDAVLNTIPPLMKEELAIPYHDIVDPILNQNLTIPYIYISSTSVFPSSFSDSSQDLPIFTEKSQPEPNSQKGKYRLQMEEKIRLIYPNVKILRAAGIYGPQRSLVEQFSDGQFSRARVNNRVVSRIHVHDLARLTLALMQNKPNIEAKALVHGVDQQPSHYAEVFSFLEKLLNISIPEKEKWKSKPIEGRYIKSLYALDLLHLNYSFPSYQEGFRYILKQMGKS